MNHRDTIIFNKIISEIEISLEMMGTLTYEEFNSNEMLKRAISMTVINIGELAKSITEDTRLLSKHIPWKEIAGFRDIAAHKYSTLKMEMVYQTVFYDFPQLKDNLQNVLKREE